MNRGRQSMNSLIKIDPAPNSLLVGDYEINKHNAIFHFGSIEVKEIRDAFATVKTALGQTKYLATF